MFKWLLGIDSKEIREDRIVADTLWAALTAYHRTRANMGHEFMIAVIRQHPHLIQMIDQGCGQTSWTFADELRDFIFTMLESGDNGVINATGSEIYRGFNGAIGWKDAKVMVRAKDGNFAKATLRAKHLEKLFLKHHDSIQLP